MGVKVFRKAERKAIAYDGSSMESALAWQTISSSGTTGSLTAMPGGKAWVAVSLTANTTYSSTYGGMDNSVELYNSSGTKVAQSSFDWDMWSTTPLSYTPSSSGIYYLKFINSMFDPEWGPESVNFSPRSGNVDAPAYTPWKTSTGFDSFGVPVQYRSAADAGIAKGSMPRLGLVLYVPMCSTSLQSTDETGKTLTWQGSSFNPTVHKSMACVEFPGSHYMYTGDLGLTTGSPAPLTTSIWFNCPSDSDNINLITFNNRWGWHTPSSVAFMVQWTNDSATVSTPSSVKDGNWHWAAATTDGSTIDIWLDGAKLSGSISYNSALQSSAAYINKKTDGTGSYTHYFAQAAVYNRKLSDTELVQLYKATTPPSTLKS